MAGSAWAMASGGLVPQPLRPPLDRLVLWVRGDAGMTLDAPTRLGRWANQHGPNDDLTSGDPAPNSEPYVLGDDVDGIPLVSFGVGVDANKGLRTGDPNPGPASDLLDHLGSPMDGSSARTWLAMIVPKFQAAFGRIGGDLLVSTSFFASFLLWDNAVPPDPTGAYAFERKCNFGPITGGALSPYNNAATLCEWRTPGYPSFAFLLNNVVKATVPPTQPFPVGGAGPAVLGGPGNPSFLGAAAELLCYDYDLSTNPAAHQRAINYMISRYPSAPITPDAP